jgi:hypothetical protein
MKLWKAWVEFCAGREDPLPMALVRIALGLVLLGDLVWIGWCQLPVLLWAPRGAGGASDPLAVKGAFLLHHAFEPSTAASWGPPLAWGLWGAAVATCASWTAGWWTRTSGLLLLLVYAQTAIANDTADRGIDRLIRIIIVLVLVSGAGRVLSLDAWRARTFWNSSAASALPRALVVGQLAVMYGSAGVEKFALPWFPWGGYSALFIILQDPIYAVQDHSFLASPPWYWTTQLGTAVSHVWEWTFPILPVLYWFQATRERPGWLRAWSNALDLRTVFVVVGVVFHLALFFTLHLGIFPLAMLALYPAFYSGPEWRSWMRRRLGSS